MANVTFRCPHCEATVRLAASQGNRSGDTVGLPASDSKSSDSASSMTRSLECTACGHRLNHQLPDNGEIKQCVVCSSDELFVRKDFPQRLGLLIVVLGFAGSSVTYFFHHLYWTYAILFATALVDVVLYVWMGNVLECYRCHAQFRDMPGLEDRDPFNLEVQERYRQQAARLKQHT